MHPDNPKLKTAKPSKWQLEISICRYMGWSYQELHTCPAEMVDVLIADISTRSYWEQKKVEVDAEKNKQKSR